MRKKTTGLLFAAAALLLLFSVAGSSRAALTYFSENYSAQISMFDIGVTLVENGRDVSWRNYSGSDDVWEEETGELLVNMLSEDEKLQPGRRYQEELTVKNSGNIDEYVRVMVYRYWVDEDGQKLTDMSPELIDLHLLTDSSGWVEDKAAATDERTVLYYTEILPEGAVAPLFADTLAVDGVVASQVEIKTEGNKTTAVYAYNGYKFMLEVETDAVQTHNAANAIKSAWGIDVAVSENGSLTLQ